MKTFILILTPIVSVCVIVVIVRHFWGKSLRDEIEMARSRFDDPEGCASADHFYDEIRSLFYGFTFMFIPQECRRIDLIHAEAVSSLKRRVIFEHGEFMRIRMSSEGTALLIKPKHKQNMSAMFLGLRRLMELAPDGPILARYSFPRRTSSEERAGAL